jgi:hypothetical protein
LFVESSIDLALSVCLFELFCSLQGGLFGEESIQKSEHGETLAANEGKAQNDNRLLFLSPLSHSTVMLSFADSLYIVLVMSFIALGVDH